MDLESFWIDSIKSEFIGDDGAVIGEKIYAMDAFWEDTHFKREWMSAEQLAYKAFMVNLSDMVAMNAEAKYMLITLAIPKNISKEYLRRLSNKFNELSKEYGIAIIGGDTIGSDKIGISITMIGESENPLRRDNIQVDDLIAYTGVLGTAKRDLDRLLKGEKIEDYSKFYNPILRIDFIKSVREYINAGMDISDGLYCDTNKFLKASSLYLKELKEVFPEVGESGEEYEMLISFSENNLEKVLEIAKATNTPLRVFAKASSKKSQFYPCKSHHF